WSEEANAVRQKPAERLRHLVAKDAPQLVVVAIGKRSGETGHVRVMPIRSVLDAFAALMWSRRRGIGAVRPRRRAAEGGLLFDQHDVAAEAPRLDRRGQPCPSSADNNDVPSLREHAPPHIAIALAQRASR